MSRPNNSVARLQVAVYDTIKNRPIISQSQVQIRQHLDELRVLRDCHVEIALIALSTSGEWITTLCSEQYHFLQRDDGHYDFVPTEIFDCRMDELTAISQTPLVEYTSAGIIKTFYQDGMLKLFMREYDEDEDEDEEIDGNPCQEGFFHTGNIPINPSCFSQKAVKGYAKEFGRLIERILFALN